MSDTVTEILACLRAWEPSARVIGNVTAGNAIEAIERLREELAECKQDAERYRAIKKGVSLYIPNPDCYDFDYVLPSDLDAMADAALAAKGE